MNANRLIGLLAALGVALVLLALFGPAWAQDAKHIQMYHSDPTYDAWFRGLTSPSGGSCCNLKDCDKVEAEWRGGAWYARVKGEMTLVPQSAILEKPLSIDGDAFACLRSTPDPVTASFIRCFIPPIPGY